VGIGPGLFDAGTPAAGRSLAMSDKPTTVAEQRYLDNLGGDGPADPIASHSGRGV